MDAIVVDLALILVVLAVVSGVIWALDAFIFAPRRRSDSDGGQAAEPVVVEYARTFFPVIVIVLVIRSFLFEPFRIPSSSMLPTLLVGDFIFVNKYAYGLRLPVLNTKVVQIGEPARGDVVVFRLPKDPSTNYIKRVVGLPGDTVVYRNKQLTINGRPVATSRNGSFPGERQELARYLESFDGVEYDVLHNQNRRFGRDLSFKVPPGQYFVMGDNRDNSKDSRFADVGFIPEQNLVGRAVAIWFHWEGWGSWPGKWNRVGDRIH